LGQIAKSSSALQVPLPVLAPGDKPTIGTVSMPWCLHFLQTKLAGPLLNKRSATFSIGQLAKSGKTSFALAETELEILLQSQY